MYLSAALRPLYLGENDSSSLCSALHKSPLTISNLPGVRKGVTKTEKSVKNRDADFVVLDSVILGNKRVQNVNVKD